MSKVTNLLMEVWCSPLVKGGERMHWKERFILGGHRAELDRLQDEMDLPANEGRGARMPVGVKDGLWWNDDMVFILDRFCANDLEPNKTVIGGMDWPKGLSEFHDKILWREYETVGEVQTYERGGLKIVVTADDSDVSEGRIKWLEEEG